MAWQPSDLPDLTGKTYVVTGGNSGLGLEATRMLAAKGARVVFTSRSADRADAAVATVGEAVPGADVSYVLLDLADADSVTAAAAAIRATCPRIDGILNNAGVMQPPEIRTKEGFELQLATNHFGHFRLNAQLFDVLDASGARIVPVSSVAHRGGTIWFEDLQLTKGYEPTRAYNQSKLANLLYGFELQRRLAARGSKATAIPCHPGYAATNLQSAGVGLEGGSWLLRTVYKVTNAVVAQDAASGAHSLVYAVADPAAEPGVYYGPTGLFQASGPVGKTFVAKHARDPELARRFWDATEALIGPFFS